MSVGDVTRLAGGGSASGTVSGSSNGIGSAAKFTSLFGIAVDTVGVVYVSDGSAVRKITPGGTFLQTFIRDLLNVGCLLFVVCCYRWQVW